MKLHIALLVGGAVATALGGGAGVDLTGAGVAALVAGESTEAQSGFAAAVPDGAQPPAPRAVTAARWALAQVGTPYQWGGEVPGVGFDCSGLVQLAYRVAGVALPRVAQDQYDAGPLLPAAVVLAPGDLVFFGGGPRNVQHVGIALGDGMMVDAPHVGATVRVEQLPTTAGAQWGSELYVGATRPAGL